MKLKWKIRIGVGIGILVLYAVLVSVLSLVWVPPYESSNQRSNPLPNIEPPPHTTPHTVDSLLSEMEFGTIAFNAPTNINIGDSPQIQLILSLSEAIDELKQSITEEGEKIGATIKVSDRMEARLSGYKFQITAITPEIQAVSKSQ